MPPTVCAAPQPPASDCRQRTGAANGGVCSAFTCPSRCLIPCRMPDWQRFIPACAPAALPVRWGARELSSRQSEGFKQAGRVLAENRGLLSAVDLCLMPSREYLGGPIFAGRGASVADGGVTAGHEPGAPAMSTAHSDRPGSSAASGAAYGAANGSHNPAAPLQGALHLYTSRLSSDVWG